MTQKTGLFVPDSDTKTLIKEISTLFGVKSNIISELLNYMAFAWLLQLSQNPEKLQTIVIPYIGRLGIKFKGDYIDSSTGEMKSEVETYLAINDSFKKMMSDINDRDISSLTAYLKENYINKLIDDTLQG